MGAVFELAWQLRGMENFLTEMAADPAIPTYMMERITDIIAEVTRRLLPRGRRRHRHGLFLRRRRQQSEPPDFEEDVADLHPPLPRETHRGRQATQQAGDVPYRRSGPAPDPRPHRDGRRRPEPNSARNGRDGARGAEARFRRAAQFPRRGGYRRPASQREAPPT